uniref:Transmembrane protein 208 n=1 Tax=Chenopodium quinoa TaxID=63459 RepID=A0A803KQ62_CHEQI
MANQGAKKRKEENARHMSNLLRLIIGCNVAYILVRMVFYYSSFTWKHWIGLILTSLAYAMPYKQLASMAKPAYTNDGELIDGGFDMSTGGVCGYGYKNSLSSLYFLICLNLDIDRHSLGHLVILGIISVIPGFAAYKASGFIKGFLSHNSEGEEEDEKTRKKREKMERKASRPKFAKSRTR